MERHFLRGIMNPAMVATWFFGLVLAGTPESSTGEWAGSGRSRSGRGVNGLPLLARWRTLSADHNSHSTQFFRASRAADPGADRHRCFVVVNRSDRADNGISAAVTL
jgi:hypothetical protein